jgi:hypothetical protein
VAARHSRISGVGGQRIASLCRQLLPSQYSLLPRWSLVSSNLWPWQAEAQELPASLATVGKRSREDEMIQATGYTHNIGYENRLAQKYGVDTPAFREAAAVVDTVTISDAGRAMNQAVSDVVNPGHDLWSLADAEGNFRSLPILSYSEARGLAEAGLKEAMRQLGIHATAKVSMTFNTDGTISVDGGGAKNAALEAMVNENGDLRNMLVAASNAAYMQRIGAAHEQVQAAVAADPSQYERAYAWLIGVSQRISSMGFQFDFSDGKLTGGFLLGGEKIGLTERMETYRA